MNISNLIFCTILFNISTLLFSASYPLYILFKFYSEMLENILAFINSSEVCVISRFKKTHKWIWENCTVLYFVFKWKLSQRCIFSKALRHCNLFWLCLIFFPIVLVTLQLLQLKAMSPHILVFFCYTNPAE